MVADGSNFIKWKILRNLIKKKKKLDWLELIFYISIQQYKYFEFGTLFISLGKSRRGCPYKKGKTQCMKKKKGSRLDVSNFLRFFGRRGKQMDSQPSI